MPIDIVPVALYPNVPNLPGVPQLLRSPLYPPSPAPTLQPVQQSALVQSAQAGPQWGIFDSTGTTQVVHPDSVLDFDNQNEWRVSDYPVHAGNFESYNKVTIPFDIVVRLCKGGSLNDRTNFLRELAAIAGTTNLYTILTPEKNYQNCNVTRYEVIRRGVEGAFFLTDVDVFFRQIIQVTAQYTSTAQLTQNASVPSALPPVSQGMVQPQPWPSISNQPVPFVLPSSPGTSFATLGNPLNAAESK